MTDEKIVLAIKAIGYEPFQDEADPEELNKYTKYCVYYPYGLKKQDQLIIHKIIEFVFVNEKEEFDELEIIEALEKIGLTFQDADYGKLKKVAGGDIVNSLTLRFARPRKRKCIY